MCLLRVQLRVRLSMTSITKLGTTAPDCIHRGCALLCGLPALLWDMPLGA